MDDATDTRKDIEELDSMEFEIFKKYWQPMMSELIELKALKDSVPEDSSIVVKRLSGEIDSLKHDIVELKQLLTTMKQPQQVNVPPSQFPINGMPYNPGLAHMPLYRTGQSFVVSPVQQANQ